jgi:hypothetical protein
MVKGPARAQWRSWFANHVLEPGPHQKAETRSRGVVNLTVLDLLHDILGFRQDSIHRIAAYGTRGNSRLIENSLQAFNVMFGLFAVFFEGAFEIGGLRALP